MQLSSLTRSRKRRFFTVTISAVFLVLIVLGILRFALAEQYDSCGSTGAFFTLNWIRPGCSGSPSPHYPDFATNSNDVRVTNDGVHVNSTITLDGNDTLSVQAPTLTVQTGGGGLIYLNGGTLEIPTGGRLQIEAGAPGLQFVSGTISLSGGDLINLEPSNYSFTQGALPYSITAQTGYQSSNFNVATLMSSPFSFEGSTPTELSIDESTGVISLTSEVIGDETGTLYVRGALSGGGYGVQAVSYTLDDTTGPSLVSVSGDSGVYGIGGNVYISVNFSEPVSYTEMSGPTLALNNGEVATYSSGSGTETWVFTYTIEEGDSGTTLLDVSSSQFPIIIYDTGANSTLTPPIPGSPNRLSDNAEIVVDASRPVIMNVTSDNSNGDYVTSQTVYITVEFDDSIGDTGTATLNLSSGGVTGIASAINDNEVVFPYTIQDGESVADLDVESINNGIEIVNVAGNSFAGSVPTGGDSTSLAYNKDISINVASLLDVEGPQVQSLNPVSSSGTYSLGEQVLFSVLFNEDVYVDGTPTIELNSGGTASYVSGHASAELIFSYTVGEGDETDDLDAVSQNALSLNGGTLLDAASNPATLTLPTPGQVNSLSYNANLVISGTIAPSNPGSGGGRRSLTEARKPDVSLLTLSVQPLTATSVNVSGTHTPQVVTTDVFGYTYVALGSGSASTSIERTDVFEATRFSKEVAGLACDTTYTFRPFAKNRIGTTYGSAVTVTTGSCNDPQSIAISDTPLNVASTTDVIEPRPITPSRMLFCPIFAALLKPGDVNEEVSRVKFFLNYIFPDSVLNTTSLQFDADTVKAVTRFQSHYRATILAPLTLTQPTGWWYQQTVDQANALLGCE